MTKAVTHDARRSQRLQHELAVTYRSVGRFLSDFATDISRGGVFVNTRHPFPVGTTVKLVIQLPGAAFPVNVTGRVKRVSAWERGSKLPAGMAIEFSDLDRGKRDWIEGCVEKLRNELGAG